MQRCLISIAAVELRHLRYFLTVAELLNFTKAARKLHVAQPALSRQIRDLELELGVLLLERNSRSVRLTEVGRGFVNEARAVLERAEEATRFVHSVANGQSGSIHVGFAPSLTVDVLPHILREYGKQFPRVRVILHDLSGQELLEGLKGKNLDAALAVISPSQAAGELKFDELCSYPVCVAVSTAHRLARARRVTVVDLKRERLLVYARDEYPDYHEWVDSMFDAELRALMAKAEEHESGTSLLAQIQAGRGVAVLPSVVGTTAGPRVKFRELFPRLEPLRIGIAHAPNKVNVATERFVEVALRLRGGAVRRAIP